MTGADGARLAEGSFELGARRQMAKFLNEEPFNIGNAVSGTLTFTSTAPIAVIALRGLTNRDGEFLMATLPVEPLASGATISSDTAYFPLFVDGDGWVTQVILVNPMDEMIEGTIEFLGPGSGATAAAPAVISLADGRTGSEFAYSIPAGSSQTFTTSNPTGALTIGSVRATPASGSVAPSGFAAVSITAGGKTFSEVGINAPTVGSAFRLYAESSGTPGQAGSIRTVLVIASAADAANSVTLEVTGLDGALAVPPLTLQVPPSGLLAGFVDELFDSLADEFSGVLRVASTADVAVAGLRLRTNERGEPKLTAIPPSDETDESTVADRFFPHIVDSAGWSTQFNLFSGIVGQSSSGTLSFIDSEGEPWDLSTENNNPEVVPPDGDGSATRHEVGGVIATLPTGFWVPDVTSGASFSFSGGSAVIVFNNGGHIEEGGLTYTCETAGGCEVRNREVISGTIVQAAVTTIPEDTQPSFAEGSGPGNQSYTVGMAIDTLTLPEASGGDGTLTYSLAPEVPGLTFNAGTRQLTGTPTAAGTYNMTYTVTDTDGDPATLNFVVTVTAVQMTTVDLVVTSASVSDNTPESGQSFDLTASVGNRGTGEADAATLRYYRSTDATITTGDTEVGTDAVSALAPEGTSDESITLTAPSTAGTYYYGACVDPVSGESDTGNNCSSAVRVTVTDSQQEIDSFDLDSDNRGVEGITLGDDRLYVVDDYSNKVYTYQTSGERDSASDFNLDSENGNPEGIAFANGKFFVIDRIDEKVYAYRVSGERDSASDFDLDSDNRFPSGITFAHDKFYVVDSSGDKVYTYRVSGERDSASDFDLDSDNGFPSGITFAHDKFYVVDLSDEKVYAYRATGQFDSASNFHLDSDTGSANGIAFANDRFYVVDSSDDKVYVLESTHELSDLVVTSRSVSDTTPTIEDSFVLSATVRNRGTSRSTTTTLRYYRSSDSTISTSDTEVGTDSVSALSASETSSETISLSAPSTPGTYYYGACVDPVSGESDTGNNCSSAVRVRVKERVPDLVVESPSVSDDTPGSDGSFDFRATVRNLGTSASAATTLRYYRSDNRTISASDMQVGTEAVSELAVDGASSQTITLPAPSAGETYYYGACVDMVAEESDTNNNCSTAVPVFGGGPFLAYDLSISSATLHSPSFGLVGDAIRMSVTLANQGPNRSQPAKLRFGNSTYLDIPALDSGATTSFADVRVGSVRLGRLTFRVCIVEAPGEEDTSNNCASRSVTYQ